MSEDEEIHLDVTRPATLHNGAVSTDFPTLKDAIMAWNRLRPEQAQRASIRIIGGQLYSAAKLPKLLNGSRFLEESEFREPLFDEDGLIMAKIQAFVTIGVLVALSSEAAIAMSPQEVPGTIASCKAITDDKQRLKCFDDLFGGPSKPEVSQEEKQANWSIDQSKSPNDGSLQVVAWISRRRYSAHSEM